MQYGRRTFSAIAASLRTRAASAASARCVSAARHDEDFRSGGYLGFVDVEFVRWFVVASSMEG